MASSESLLFLSVYIVFYHVILKLP